MENENTELKQEVENETTNPEAPQEETNEHSSEQDGEPVEKTDEEEQESVIDYEAELERLQNERDNYKEGMLVAKRKLKDVQKKQTDEDFDESINDEIQEKVKEAARKELDSFKMDLISDTVGDILNEIAESDSEMKLIKYHYENTLIKSGYNKASITRDIQRAKLLANESKMKREKKELEEALRAKATLSKKPIGSSSKSDTENWKGYSESDKVIMKKFGLTPKDIKK